jgi:L-lysine exporter family protein LysE/ArgO
MYLRADFLAKKRGSAMSETITATLLTPLIQGFLLCASMIIAFGPQNLFLLRQGLRRQHLFTVALFSTLADIVLITLGVGGFSALISNHPTFQAIVTVAGVLFLMWCGGRSLLSAWHPTNAQSCEAAAVQSNTKGLYTTILATLSFSFLNPAAYVDTLMIIGSKSLLFAVDQRVIFGIGAVCASAFWFFTLTYGASKLTLIFRSPTVWRTLDVISGCIMLGIASTLFAASCNVT